MINPFLIGLIDARQGAEYRNPFTEASQMHAYHEGYYYHG